MARRATLVLPRVPAFRPRAVPSLRRPKIGAPSRRSILIAAVAVGALAGAYVAARETSLFALRVVEVAGAPAPVETQVRRALEPLAGTSLVALDPSEVEARVRAVPTVRTARVDRGFPHTLTVVVRPEQPLAVIRDGTRAWLLAESGRVVGTLGPADRPRLPRIRAELRSPLRVGSSVGAEEVRTALRVLRSVPKRFPVGVLYAKASDGSVQLVLRGGLEVRLGPASDVEAKLRAAAAVLRSLEETELVGIGYLDVSVPGHAVSGTDPQVESES